MTDAQTNPMQDASTYGRKASSWSDPHQAPPDTKDMWHVESNPHVGPPPFHCENCPHGSFGSIIEDTWEPKPCKCMEDQYLE